ncbi:unnamed protein product [Ectocarpus sp. 6 AP-2014]
MEENAFLSDFFGCIGFLPLTTTSHIRETMVKIMTPRSSLQQSAVGADERFVDTNAPGANWIKASERNQLPMDLSTCTFWCAIALGALAKGRPIESASLPRPALSERYQSTLNWHRKLLLRETPVRQTWRSRRFGEFRIWLKPTCILLLRPYADQGFAEIVKHKYSPFSSSGHQGQMKSYRSREEATPPQLNEAATEIELYQYVAQSYRAYEQILHQLASNQIATTCENQCDAESDRGLDSGLRSDHVLLPREVSGAIGTYFESVRCLSFEPLEEAVDRPSVRGGFGGLLINLGLIFTKAAQGDLHAALERIGRCVEVCERYPGLCRSTVGCHLAHIALVSLAAIGGSRAQTMYDRLRGSYNSCRPAGSRPVPPLEEWDRVDAFCDDSFCRAMDLASGKLNALSAPSVDSIDTCVEGKGTDSDKGETIFQEGWQTQSAPLPASNIPEKVINTVPDWPTEGESECCVGSTQASASPTASPVSSAYPRCGLKTDLHSDRVERTFDSVDIAPERFSRLPGTRDGGGVVADAEEDSIGAENWLDVTHGMLDAL